MLVLLSGRSARDHTLSINMRRMTQLEVSLSDPRSDTNMTMTLGTGVIWEDAYEEVNLEDTMRARPGFGERTSLR